MISVVAATFAATFAVGVVARHTGSPSNTNDVVFAEPIDADAICRPASRSQSASGKTDCPGCGTTASLRNAGDLGLALRGYDPVAYFREQAPRRGSAAIQARWNGAVYRFSSEESRDAFLLDPARYAPQYGGSDALGARYGERRGADPLLFRIVNGRLFLLSDAAALEEWSSDQTQSIAVADAVWHRMAALLAR